MVFKNKKNIFTYLIIIIIAIIVYRYTGTINTSTLSSNSKIVVIDAGHGGSDPGKVGYTGLNEKDINLAIAKKLQAYLEQNGCIVFMTRIDDNGLHDEGVSNKKRSDLSNRKELINNSGGDILISIHQNSFTQEKYKGAQVFYYKYSEEGERLAKLIQSEIKNNVDSTNNREIKYSDSYYILNNTEIPAVIVECGFLSNREEEKNLNSAKYQQEIAWAIYLAINKYFDE